MVAMLSRKVRMSRKSLASKFSKEICVINLGWYLYVDAMVT